MGPAIQQGTAPEILAGTFGQPAQAGNRLSLMIVAKAT